MNEDALSIFIKTKFSTYARTLPPIGVRVDSLLTSPPRRGRAHVSEFVSNSISLLHNLTHGHARDIKSNCLKYPVKQGHYSTCHKLAQFNTQALNSLRDAEVAGSSPATPTSYTYFLSYLKRVNNIRDR